LVADCEVTFHYKLNFFYFFHVFKDDFSCDIETRFELLQKFDHERAVDSIFPIIGTNSFILIAEVGP
jgi:hypothetical protein